MGWNGNILTAPISLGDISVAAGIGGDTYDLGYMIANGSYKIMSKCKPVRSSSPGVLSMNERKAVRYGFGASLPPLLGGTLDAVWSYEKPRGLATYNEWYRALDFDGYYSQANYVPLKAEIEVTKGTGSISQASLGSVTVTLKMNANVDSRWTSNCMSFRDFLDSGHTSMWNDYVFAFLITDVTRSESTFVVTSKSPSDLFGSGEGTLAVFGFYEDDHYPGDGTVDPRVPALYSANTSDTFRVIACLVVRETMGTTGNLQNNYNVYTNNTSPTWQRVYSAYTLAFASGCDRANGICKGMWSIANITGSNFVLSAVSDSTGIAMKENGSSINALGHKYLFTLTGNYDTTNCPDWSQASALGTLPALVVIDLVMTNVSQLGTFCHDDDVVHYSWSSIQTQGYQTMRWSKGFNLANQRAVTGVTISPFYDPSNGGVESNPDHGYAVQYYSGAPASATFYAKVYFEYGGDTVLVGTSNSVTITY